MDIDDQKKTYKGFILIASIFGAFIVWLMLMLAAFVA